MASMLQGVDVRLIALGIQVKRTAAVTPQSTATPYFTVSGGRILLTSIVGECTVVFTATATNLKLTSTPTVGTAVDMCAVVAAANKEAGTLFGISGLPSDAMIATNAGLTTGMKQQLIIPTGTIDFSSSGNNTTSQTKWVLHYIPIDDGAQVVAA